MSRSIKAWASLSRISPTPPVNSTAVCFAYTVLNDPETQEAYFNYTDNEGHPQQLYVQIWAPGCVTYISDSNSSCGPRCTRVLALQAKQLPANNTSNTMLNITSSMIFDCNNTVSEIRNLTSGGTAKILFNETQAQLVACAIGWTGFAGQILNTSKIDTRNTISTRPTHTGRHPIKLGRETC